MAPVAELMVMAASPSGAAGNPGDWYSATPTALGSPASLIVVKLVTPPNCAADPNLYSRLSVTSGS
eukprot:762023-Prorocentrum_minimum.AAC.1